MFVREVDDAVRRSDMEAFGKRYGWWILGLIILGLAVFGGYIIWSNQQTAADGKLAEQYITAMDAADARDFKAADAILAKLDDSASEGYQGLSRLMRANIAASRKDSSKAVAEYQAVIDDQSLPQDFRHLALVRQTAVQFDAIPPALVIKRLKPLAVEGSPWFGPAGEMTALAYVKLGKTDLAGALLGALSKDKDVPESIRARTRQLAGVYGVDAVQDDESPADAASAPSDAARGAK